MKHTIVPSKIKALVAICALGLSSALHAVPILLAYTTQIQTQPALKVMRKWPFGHSRQ